MLPRASVLAFSCVFAAFAGLTACSENGVTPSACPPLPLYNPQETGPTEDDGIRAQLDQAVDAGCATAIGTARTPQASGGTGGTGQGQAEAGAGGDGN
jgi:hypothetical protein